MPDGPVQITSVDFVRAVADAQLGRTVDETVLLAHAVRRQRFADAQVYAPPDPAADTIVERVLTKVVLLYVACGRDDDRFAYFNSTAAADGPGDYEARLDTITAALDAGTMMVDPDDYAAFVDRRNGSGTRQQRRARERRMEKRAAVVAKRLRAR